MKKVYVCFISPGNSLEDTLLCEEATKVYNTEEDAKNYCYRINTMRRADHSRYQEFEVE